MDLQATGVQAQGAAEPSRGPPLPSARGAPPSPEPVEHRASLMTVLPGVRAPILKRKALPWMRRTLMEN
uniref:Coordinator of PRMT5 and differentiation stimulator n=1 Tax=Nomascus leucogenys TaxID=61853 RepID=A0A2I3GRS1_NOMLE